VIGVHPIGANSCKPGRANKLILGNQAAPFGPLQLNPTAGLFSSRIKFKIVKILLIINNIFITFGRTYYFYLELLYQDFNKKPTERGRLT